MRKAILTSLLSTTLFAQADLIIHNARIVTVDPKFSTAQAMAIRGERILAVGTNEAILRQATPSTQRIDMKGKTVLPGLMDTHVHANGAAMYEFDHPVPDMETLADILKYIAGRAAVLPEGEWIRLSQVFVTRIREQRFPTRQSRCADRCHTRKTLATGR